MPAPVKLQIYSKKECHLCDKAKEVLQRLAKEYSLAVQEIDIEQDSETFDRFRYEIPVIFLEGTRLFKYRIDEKKLRKAIESRLGKKFLIASERKKD